MSEASPIRSINGKRNLPAAMLRSIRIVLGTLSMYLLTHLFVFATLPFAILISYVDQDRMPAIKQWFVRSLYAIVGKKLKISGHGKVRPDRGYVIVSNYPSFYAGFSLIGTFPRASVVAHAFMKKIPLLRQALNRAGTIFVQPGRAGKGKRAIELDLSQRQASQSVIILPEGARTPDGRIHRFRRGFIHILRRTSLDLLPVTLNGLYTLEPMRRFYLDPDAEPEMIIHEPISNSSVRKMSDRELLAKVQGVIGSAYRP